MAIKALTGFDSLVPVWVEMPPDPGRSYRSGEEIPMPWKLEAMMDLNAKHPSGKDHLVKVRYLYIMYSGWIKKERITPR